MILKPDSICLLIGTRSIASSTGEKNIGSASTRKWWNLGLILKNIFITVERSSWGRVMGPYLELC
jgi:hypothetical protein